jgi:lipopolysaccharide export system protein LptC
MERLDDQLLYMEEMRITMYAKPGEQNTLISTEHGVYNLEKGEFTSDTRTRIEQKGVFDLEGDDMVFDANTQKRKMTGNVKMLLYKMGEKMMPNKAPKDKAKVKREEDGK